MRQIRIRCDPCTLNPCPYVRETQAMVPHLHREAENNAILRFIHVSHASGFKETPQTRTLALQTSITQGRFAHTHWKCTPSEGIRKLCTEKYEPNTREKHFHSLYFDTNQSKLLFIAIPNTWPLVRHGSRCRQTLFGFLHAFKHNGLCLKWNHLRRLGICDRDHRNLVSKSLGVHEMSQQHFCLANGIWLHQVLSELLLIFIFDTSAHIEFEKRSDLFLRDLACWYLHHVLLPFLSTPKIVDSFSGSWALGVLEVRRNYVSILSNPTCLCLVAPVIAFLTQMILAALKKEPGVGLLVIPWSWHVPKYVPLQPHVGTDPNHIHNAHSAARGCSHLLRCRAPPNPRDNFSFVFHSTRHPLHPVLLWSRDSHPHNPLAAKHPGSHRNFLSFLILEVILHLHHVNMVLAAWLAPQIVWARCPQQRT